VILDFTGYLAERADEFTGREWVIDAVAAWRDDPAGERCFLITGEPGIGKTAVAARLAAEAGWVDAVHFCSARDRRWVNPRTFAESVSGQLAAAKPAFGAALLRRSAPNVSLQQTVAGDNVGRMVGVETLVVDGSAEDVFDRLVREPLEALTEPVVLLVDALDESLAYSGRVTIADLVAQSAHLPPSVRFVLTCRPLLDLVRMLRQPGARQCVLSPHEDPGRNLALHDVERYVARLAPTVDLDPELSVPEFVATVRDRSGGNFLFTRHLLYNLDQQKGPVTRAAILALPRSLDGVYLDFLYRLASQGRRRQYRDIAAILAILAVAQQPFDEGRIAWATGLPAATVRGALADLRQFLDTDDAVPAAARTYALYHASFGELLLDRDRAEEYWVDGPAAHHAIADAYLEAHRGDWSRCDDYGLNHLATHLYEAGDVGPLQSLVDAAWIAERRTRRNGGYDGVLADLDLAWQAAELADRSAVADGLPAPYLADELRWALTIASVGTRILPTALLRELALTGVWTPDQALGYARLNRSAPDRAEALASLAVALPEPQRAEARQEAVAVAERLVAAGLESAAERRVATLSKLMPLLPSDLRRRAAGAALGNTRQLSDERRVATGNTGYYASEPGELFRHTGLRSTALDRIAAALTRAGWPDDGSTQLRAEMQRVCGLPDDAAFNEATTALLTRLTDAPPQAEPAQLEAGDAVTDARRADVRRRLAEAASKPFDDADLRAATAAALTDNRPSAGPHVDAAHATSERSSTVDAAGWPTAAVDDPVGRLAELIRTAPLPYIIAREESIVAAPYQAAALTALAGRLPDDAMTKALEFAEHIGDRAARHRAVRALGPFLTEPALRAAVAQIRPDSRDMAERLAPLVDVLPGPLLLDALAAVRRIDDDATRMAGLAVLASHLPEPQASEVTSAVAEWLATTNVANPGDRAALTATARHLPASLAAGVFAALRDAVQRADAWPGSDQEVATAILGLAPQLPEPDRTEALQLVQRAADLSTWGYGSWGSGLTDDQAPIVEALDLGRELPPSPERDRLLGTLAHQAIDWARTAQYGRGYETWNLRYRIVLFILLLPHLLEPHLSEAAETVVRIIVDKAAVPLPVNQTASLAAYLPAPLLPAAERAITDAPLPLFLPEKSLTAALDIATQRGNIDWLLAVADRGQLAECLTAAEKLGGAMLRIELITRHAHRLAKIPLPDLHDVWTATLHGLADLDRPRFLGYLRDLGPIITALSGPDGVAAAAHTVEAVATVWP
jgi:hypothetical protein